ncbi:hypothetical protein BGZ70_008394 [Mortierella alpina]|uniref:Uncharacterized protein n=1 Tax=Mortierella alpina TaxID=64518 RepID=A0A9P6JFI6_MORAP|nr:hypothetical protein BGZ70_008394 [Mortierella alpina]
MGCFVAMSQAAPCMSDWADRSIQYPLSYKNHTTIIIDDGKNPRGIPILGGKVDSIDELIQEMENLIKTTMPIRYKPDLYHQAFMQEFCSSAEVGFSASASAKPFGMGVEFTVFASYGFSESREASTTLSYESDLEKHEKGYIAL